MSLFSFLQILSLSSRLSMGISVILPGSKDTFLYHSTSLLFQETSFHFCDALQHCMRLKWQMVSQLYFCCVPKLTKPALL